MKKIIAFCLLITLNGYSQKQPNVSIDEQIFYFTTRIVCDYKIGGKLVKGSGTGFFFAFDQNDISKRTVIITNKHVVKNAISGRFDLIRINQFGLPDTNTLSINLDNFEKHWIPHPDPNVDLCLISLDYLLRKTKNKAEFFFISLSPKEIPDVKEWRELKALENVKMVGYPNGLSDTLNNLPIVRSGTTATPPYYDYNGQKMFMIDAPCFWGSSGSPVLVYEIGTSTDKHGLLYAQSRFFLLGVLFAGPIMSIKGEIKMQNAPIPHTSTDVPINLGYVIKADRILEFEKLFGR